MTCFWDGIIRDLTQEDLQLLNSNKKGVFRPMYKCNLNKT